MPTIDELLSTATCNVERYGPVYEGIVYQNKEYEGHYGVSDSKRILVLWPNGQIYYPLKKNKGEIRIVENLQDK